MATTEGGIAIHLAAERVFTLFGLPITNTLLTTWLTIVVIALIAFLVGRNPKMIPRRAQGFFELLFTSVMDFMTETLESKDRARRFFPLVMSIFLFILIANLVGLFPGIDSIGLIKGDPGHEHLVAFFHPVNTDLNATLAVTIVAFLSIEIAGVTTIGLLKYAGKFVNFKSPIGFVVGIIELISELARLISFSFRLFGNIFAGKTLILVIMFFVPFIVPVPFILFEVFVAFVQAAIFALLTLFFIKIAIEEPH